MSVPVGLTEEGVEQARLLGEALRSEPLDLCVTSELERARTTADLALAGRDVPRVVRGELNDPLYGPFEGRSARGLSRVGRRRRRRRSPGPGGRAVYAIIDRYARAFRTLLASPEDTILVVAHSLPVAYALGARDGLEPRARLPLAAYATPFPFSAAELERVAAVLERWLAAPTW